jgi:hypothetical protein
MAGPAGVYCHFSLVMPSGPNNVRAANWSTFSPVAFLQYRP